MNKTLSLPLGQLLHTFANEHLIGGTASAAYQTLYRAVSSSPQLILQMDKALAEGRLKKLDILDADSPRGAEYSSGTIRIKLQDLTDPRNFNFLIKTLGHETQHALFDDERARQASKHFFEQIKTLAASKELDHDYTSLLAEYQTFRAEDEARAEIAGWNATVSFLRNENPDTTFAKLAEETKGFSVKFIASDWPAEPTTYTLKPGLTLNADLSIDDSDTNIQAMTEYYYYAPPDQSWFGHHKDSDYSNDYLGPMISTICWFEEEQQRLNPDREPPRVILGMTQLNLTERLLERNGQYLGGEDKQCRYFDSDGPDRPFYFDHTAQTHEYIPNEPDGTRLPTPPEEPLPPRGQGYTTDDSNTQGGPFEHGDVLPRSDEALPEETLEPEVQPEPALSPGVQRLKDDLDEQLKPKLQATGCCSEQHADAMVAEGVKRCVEHGAESVICAGIDEGHNRLVLQTDKKYNGLLVYDAIEASRVEPEQTLREADRLARGEQEQQIQQIQEQDIQLDAEFLEQQQQQAQQAQQQQQEFVHRLVREREERVMRMEEM